MWGYFSFYNDTLLGTSTLRFACCEVYKVQSLTDCLKIQKIISRTAEPILGLYDSFEGIFHAESEFDNDNLNLWLFWKKKSKLRAVVCSRRPLRESYWRIIWIKTGQANMIRLKWAHLGEVLTHLSDLPSSDRRIHGDVNNIVFVQVERVLRSHCRVPHEHHDTNMPMDSLILCCNLIWWDEIAGWGKVCFANEMAHNA